MTYRVDTEVGGNIWVFTPDGRFIIATPDAPGFETLEEARQAFDEACRRIRNRRLDTMPWRARYWINIWSEGPENPVGFPVLTSHASAVVEPR